MIDRVCDHKIPYCVTTNIFKKNKRTQKIKNQKIKNGNANTIRISLSVLRRENGIEWYRMV